MIVKLNSPNQFVRWVNLTHVIELRSDWTWGFQCIDLIMVNGTSIRVVETPDQIAALMNPKEVE